MRLLRLWHLTLLIPFVLVFFPSDGLSAAQAPTSQDCLLCHGNPDLERSRTVPGKPASVFIDEEGMRTSVHGRLDCAACHKGATAPHGPGLRTPGIETCAACHGQAVGEYRESIHGRSREAGGAEAATCTSCHGNIHAVLGKSDPRSPVYHLNLPRTCAQCHGDAELAKRYHISEVYQLYMDSIHGRAVSRSGLLVAANCSSCHGYHDIRSSKDAASRVHRSRVAETCGSCHGGILNEYRESIHGRQFAAGLFSAPVCTDCHAAHEIRPVRMEAWQLDVVKECGSCHRESERTFRDTFHGQVTSLGFTRVARCADCHGAHNIQPARDPRSTIHPDSTVETCRKCHAGATAGFAQYDPHADPHDRNRSVVLYYTGRFMTLLLLGVFAFFGIHTLLWAIRSAIAKWSGEIPRGRSTATGPYYFRFTLAQRYLHGVLIVSFLGIVITGMPLLYSQSDWAVSLARLLGGFGVMGFFHRVFAVALTLMFLYHLVQILYWVVIQRDWGVLWGPNSLVPQPRDILDILRNFFWFFGLGSRPRFGRFTYWEKFDYFAVFWGMPVIGFTGYVLWFDEFFARFIPGWWFNVAQLVHGEEALLATAFIFTIHYFNTHLRPEKFPMDLVIFTGRVSEAELREERPQQYNELVEQGRLSAIEADPPARWLKNFGWIVGAIAVAIGLLMFVLILIAVFDG